MLLQEKIVQCFNKKRRFSCFGYGKTMQDLTNRFNNCDVFDDKFTETVHIENNNLYPIKFFDPDKSFLEIVSPGIPPHHYLVQHAKNLISEYDFFYHIMPYSIWISGTNGKTTTTQMLALIMQKYNCEYGGNIGKSLSIMDHTKNYWILETSSYTLHYTKIAKPNIYVLLPITIDHIDWHGSFDNYENAKLQVLSRMNKTNYAIIPSKYKNISTNANVYYYDQNNLHDILNFFNIDQSKIKFKGCFLLNAILSLIVTKILFNDVDYELINSFNIDKHRQQEIYDKYGRLWINDSKSTTEDSTMQVINTYKDKYIYLILGGDLKGCTLDNLFMFLKEIKNIEIFAIGTSADFIYDKCISLGIKCDKTILLQKAVDIISKYHTKDSIAILSPAAASKDQFKSFEDRGDKFIDYVMSL